MEGGGGDRGGGGRGGGEKGIRAVSGVFIDDASDDIFFKGPALLFCFVRTPVE